MGCPRCGNFPTDDGEVEIFECENNPQHIFCNGCGNGTKHERSYVLREAGWFWPKREVRRYPTPMYARYVTLDVRGYGANTLIIAMINASL